MKFGNENGFRKVSASDVKVTFGSMWADVRLHISLRSAVRNV